MLCSSNSIAGTWMTNPIRISPIRRRPGQAGFTMMELLIGIAVLAILTTLAVPAFTQFIANNRLAAEANELVASFQFARSEALKRGLPVQICSSDVGTACDGDWNQGWIAIVDPGGTEEVIRVWTASDDAFEFTPTSGTARFAPAGCLDTNGDGNCGADDNAIDFELQFPGCTTDNARLVTLERTGRVASERVNCPT